MKNKTKYFSMKVVGNREMYGEGGFTENLNKFFQFLSQFRESPMMLPHGVLKFKTFHEADEWWDQILTEKNPERRH